MGARHVMLFCMATHKQSLTELASVQFTDNCYLQAAYTQLLKAAAELVQHETCLQVDAGKPEAVQRFAGATCYIHMALNNMRKLADDLNDMCAECCNILDAYYKLRYAVDDNLPGHVEAPKW